MAGGETHSELAYGSFVGLGAAAVTACAAVWLLETRLRFSQPGRSSSRRPRGLCRYLVLVVVPWWRVLPANLRFDLSFAPVSLLTMTGVLLAIRLAGLWAKGPARGGVDALGLLLVPAAMLVLAAIDIVDLRSRERYWGAGPVVGLCLFLVAAGLVARRGGLRHLRVPEILRVDRLPGAN